MPLCQDFFYTVYLLSPAGESGIFWDQNAAFVQLDFHGLPSGALVKPSGSGLDEFQGRLNQSRSGSATSGLGPPGHSRQVKARIPDFMGDEIADDLIDGCHPGGPTDSPFTVLGDCPTVDPRRGALTHLTVGFAHSVQVHMVAQRCQPTPATGDAAGRVGRRAMIRTPPFGSTSFAPRSSAAGSADTAPALPAA